MMENKIVIVTGSSSGIGIETVRSLLNFDMKIVMACRNMEKAGAVRDVFEKESGKEIDLMQLDLANLASIKEFASVFEKKYDRLNILINNAGVFSRRHVLTEDGFEMTMGVNYFGTVFLTYHLLPILIKNQHSKIINLSSGAYYGGRLKLDKDSFGAKSNFPAYSASKLALMYFSYELADRISKFGVTVNMVNPGKSITNIFPSTVWYWRLANRMMARNALTPFEAAQTTVYTATSKALNGISGKYLEKSQIAEVKENVFSEGMQKELWQKTCDQLSIDHDRYL